MPEGDTVWLAARRLDSALTGQVLTRWDMRTPALATTDLTGHAVLGVASRGKHILLRVDGGLTLHTHFRMDGSWHLYRPGRPWRGGPEWQIRAILATEDWTAVGYRLPVIDLLPTAEEDSVVGHLGPDLLADEWDAPEARKRLLADPDRPAGEALLDQRVVAGLGLIYVTETLFLSGVAPHAPVSAIGDPDALLARSRRLLWANRERGAQASTGSLRGQHYVYGRAGRPCRRCGTTIRHGRQGTGIHERDAYWCPACQPG
ncbi:MAG: Fpg/Nei family DNA glycosylase [bacterium]